MKNYIYYIYWLIRSYKLRKNFPKYQILSASETIEDITTHQKSISRFGDGEFRLLLQERDIYFQPLSINLTERLKEVLLSDVPNLIIAIPGTFNSAKNLKRDPKVHWLNFINLYGLKLSSFFYTNRMYGNSLISRFYMDYKDKSNVVKTVQSLKKIWDDQDILFVEGKFSRLGIGNDLFDNAKSIERIICPAENAFQSYDPILNKVKELGKSKLIIIALGPTATILAHDLARENYWALDLGHIDIEYSWFIQNAKGKVPVKGKKSAEVNCKESFELNYFEETIYRESILAQIS